MSQIADIYTYIGNQAISVGGITPIAFGLSALPNVIESARLPCRLLVPTGSRLGTGSYEKIGLGGQTGGAIIRWTITDMLLWRAAAAGQGIRDIAETLVRYCGAYAEMTRSLRFASWNIQEIQIQPQLIEWPSGGDRWYDGAVCILTVSEILQG
jgi:hypothetical protein